MQMCPQCSHDNPDAAQFCAACREPLRGLLGAQTLLQGRYRVTRVLGCGGMGAVYYTLDTRLGNRPVAVKENLDTSPQAQAQFQREALILAQLRHPNLPAVSDHFVESGGRQYLVMDYVEGESLETMVQRQGPLPETQVLAWIGQVLNALDYLHSQSPPVIHRDIKPGNIGVYAAGYSHHRTQPGPPRQPHTHPTANAHPSGRWRPVGVRHRPRWFHGDLHHPTRRHRAAPAHAQQRL